MALPLKDAFTARALGTVWDSYKATLGLPPYLGRSFFGTDKMVGLDLKFILGEDAMPRALKGSNFDAQAPLRDGIGFSTIENNMPFFRESYMVTEKEEQEYAAFERADNAALANQVLQRIIKKPLNLVQGANVVPERMIWQLMAPTDGIPKITVNVDGSTYAIDYTTDNGVAYKSTNYSAINSAADKWNAPNTAKPLEDLINFKKDFRTKTGRILTKIAMNDTTWGALCSAEDTKKQVQGVTAYNAGLYLSESDVKAYIADKIGLTVFVYNAMYENESGNNATFIPDYVVSAVAGDANLGTVWYGTTPEERSGDLSIGNLSIVETGVSIYTYTTPHPINTHSVVSEIVLPSYEGMNNVAIMKVA